MLVLLVLDLLALVLLLVRAVSKISSCWAISTWTLDLSCTIILRELAALVWEDRLWEGRGGRWEDTLVGRRVIALVVVSPSTKVQMETIVGVHGR